MRGWRVAVARRRIGAHHVDVAPAGDVPQIGAFAARQHDRQRRVVGGAHAIFQCDEIHGITHGDSWAPNPTTQVCRKTTTGYVEVLDVDDLFPPSVNAATAGIRRLFRVS